MARHKCARQMCPRIYIALNEQSSHALDFGYEVRTSDKLLSNCGKKIQRNGMRAEAKARELAGVTMLSDQGKIIPTQLSGQVFCDFVTWSRDHDDHHLFTISSPILFSWLDRKL